jgi:hypothetical protein
MASDIPSGTPALPERSCKRDGDVVDFGGRQVAQGPCVDREGRTVQHSAYVFPSSRNTILRWSLVAACALAFTLSVLFFAGARARPGGDGSGLRAVLSPGATSAPHSLATLDCAQCHREGHGVEDARCERCHDAGISARLTNAAHALQGTGDLQQAMAAASVPCTTCHVEHRGASVQLTDVNDRECGRCHRAVPGGFRALTLASHPEFASVRAGGEWGSGLRWFNHKLHLKEVDKKHQAGCEACHVRGRDEASFTPISFQSHCAECHNADLKESAGSLPAVVVKALGPTTGSLLLQADADDPTSSRLSGIAHADPWLLRAVQRLRSVADPVSFAAERLTLDRQVGQLQLLMRPGASSRPVSWTGLPSTTRPSERPDDEASSQSVEDALRESVTAAQTLVDVTQSLGVAKPEVENAVSGLREAIKRASTQVTTGTTPRPNAETGQVSAAKTAEVTKRLIDATIARAEAAGDQDLASRARALQSRAEKASRSGASGTPAAADRFDAVLQELGKAPTTHVRSEIKSIEYLAEAAAQRRGEGVDPTAFDLHRQQILVVLDQVERSLTSPVAATRPDRRAEAILARTGALRQRVLAVYYGLPQELIRKRAEFFGQRERDRARVDSELDAHGIRIPPPAPPDPDFRSMARRFAQLQLRLAAMGGAPPSSPSISVADATAGIRALLGSEAKDRDANASAKNQCTYCHELAPGGYQLAPVRSAGASLLVNANFTHAPHVTAGATNCTETCHAGILQSTDARDLNIPGIQSCRTCHASGQSAARATSCQACHSYHARGRNALLWIP